MRTGHEPDQRLRLMHVRVRFWLGHSSRNNTMPTREDSDTAAAAAHISSCSEQPLWILRQPWNAFSTEKGLDFHHAETTETCSPEIQSSLHGLQVERLAKSEAQMPEIFVLTVHRLPLLQVPDPSKNARLSARDEKCSRSRSRNQRKRVVAAFLRRPSSNLEIGRPLVGTLPQGQGQTTRSAKSIHSKIEVSNSDRRSQTYEAKACCASSRRRKLDLHGDRWGSKQKKQPTPAGAGDALEEKNSHQIGLGMRGPRQQKVLQRRRAN